MTLQYLLRLAGYNDDKIRDDVRVGRILVVEQRTCSYMARNIYMMRNLRGSSMHGRQVGGVLAGSHARGDALNRTNHFKLCEDCIRGKKDLSRRWRGQRGPSRWSPAISPLVYSRRLAGRHFPPSLTDPLTYFRCNISANARQSFMLLTQWRCCCIWRTSVSNSQKMSAEITNGIKSIAISTRFRLPQVVCVCRRQVQIDRCHRSPRLAGCPASIYATNSASVRDSG